MELDPVKIFTWVKDAGALGLLTLAVIGGFKGWYVRRWTYDAIAKDRNEWKSIALHLMKLTDAVLQSTAQPGER